MPASATPAHEVRARVMDAMAAAVAEKGYGPVTINDVVRHAAISKSTFYGQFAGKEDCFLAAYAAASEQVLDVLVRAASAPGEPAAARVRAATGAYLSTMAASPALTRTFIVEVLAAGPAALAARHAVNARFAAVLRELTEANRRVDPGAGVLSETAALVVVGGINELVLAAVVEDRVARLPELAPAVAALVRAAVEAPEG